jgi:inner membrane protein
MVIASLLPDLDVAGFAFGLRFTGALGHRGLTHSLAFALALGLLALAAAPRLRARRDIAFIAVFLAVLSHIALDAATSGGSGVAFFWPFDETRHFFPWRPILVSPFSPRQFFSSWGAQIMLSELRWVWLPCAAFAFSGFLLRRTLRNRAPYPPSS